jgi:tetratricopeptide (TPR) repeat protein
MVTRQVLLAAVLFLPLMGILAQENPNSLESHYQAAQQAQQQRDYARAADEWKAIVALSPKLAEAHANLGMMYQLLRRQREAIESFKTALELNPKLASVRLFLGMAYYLTSRPDLAIEQLRQAVSLNPQDASTAQKWLGMSYLYAGDFERAVSGLRLSHLNNPRDEEGTFYLGRAYFRLSISAFRSVGSMQPGSFWDHLIKGEQYFVQEAYPEALAEFRQALLADPAASDIHFRRALVFETQGKPSNAIEEYGKELLDRPQHLQSITKLVQLLRQSGLNKEADEVLRLGRMAFEGYPKSLAVLARLPAEIHSPAEKGEAGEESSLSAAHVFLSGYTERIRASRARSLAWPEEVRRALDRGDAEDALRLLSSPAAGIGNDRVEEWKAQSQMARGDFDQALDILVQLTAKEPKNPEYSFYLGECAQSLALSTLDEFVRTAPNSYRTYQLQGEYWVARKNFPKAVDAYERALALKPTASQIHLALGWIYLNEDRFEKAVVQLEAELRTDPYSMSALVGMGQVYFKLGQTGRAREYLRQALTINPKSPEAHVWLGKVSAQEESYADAVVHFQDALKSGVYDRGAIYFQLGQALRKLGRKEEANHYLGLFSQSKAEESQKAPLLPEDMNIAHPVPGDK